MWAELPDSVRDNFILYSMSSFKNILKVTLLKLAMLSWSWTPNLFTFYFSQRLPWSFQHVGLVCGWVDWLDGWAVNWVGGFCGCGFGVGGFATCWNCFFMGIRWLEYFWYMFCAILFNVLYVLVSVGWRSLTLRVTAIYCFWLFQANSLGHIFIIFYLCNVLLLL